MYSMLSDRQIRKHSYIKGRFWINEKKKYNSGVWTLLWDNDNNFIDHSSDTFMLSCSIYITAFLLRVYIYSDTSKSFIGILCKHIYSICGISYKCRDGTYSCVGIGKV